MNKNNTKVIFLSQSAGETVHELADKCAEEFGKTLFITGSKFRESKDNLEMMEAPKYDNSSYLTRLQTWVTFFFYTFFALRNVKGKPILVISTNPPFLPLIGYIYNKIYGWKYITRVLDVYPDALVQNNLITSKNPIYKMWGYLNRLMYKRASHVITIGDIMAEKTSEYVVEPREIDVIPNWVNCKHYHPINRSDNWFAKKYFDQEKMIVMYSGNLALTHDTDTLFAGMSLLQRQKEMFFSIIGGGARKNEAEKQSRLLKNLKYLPYQSEQALPFSLAAADVAIVSLGRGTEGISMPSKLYFNMASGCAILGISDGRNDLKSTVEGHGCGINIENGDVDGFVSAILKFKNEKDFLRKCKENSRKASFEHFSSNAVLPRYIEIIERLITHD